MSGPPSMILLSSNIFIKRRIIILQKLMCSALLNLQYTSLCKVGFQCFLEILSIRNLKMFDVQIASEDGGCSCTEFSIDLGMLEVVMRGKRVPDDIGSQESWMSSHQSAVDGETSRSATLSASAFPGMRRREYLTRKAVTSFQTASTWSFGRSCLYYRPLEL